MARHNLNKAQTVGLGLAVTAALCSVLRSGRLNTCARVLAEPSQLNRHARLQSFLHNHFACRTQTQIRADEPLAIYNDALADGWQDWSWASHALGATLHVHSGKCA